jgi:hypothetical protein
VCVAANSRPVVALVDISDDEDDHNPSTGEQRVDRSRASWTSHSLIGGTSNSSSGIIDDNISKDKVYSHSTSAQYKRKAHPSDNRNNIIRHQDDDTKSSDGSLWSTHDTMDNELTCVNTSQPPNKPSAYRKTRSNLPNQSGEGTEITTPLLSSGDAQINVKVTTHDNQRLSSDILHTAAISGYSLSSQFFGQWPEAPTKVKANDNVAMTTKYTWDSNIPSHWAPMDGSSVKTVVLHPTDSEYQLVADTFLASLGNTLATVIQVY